MKRLFDRLFFGAQQTVRFEDDDVALVAYPKSGSTWLRLVLGNYLTGQKTDLVSIQQIVPDIHYDMRSWRLLPRPRFAKSHLAFTPAYRKIVYMARDARDVAVSYFHHCQKFGQIEKNTSFGVFLSEFNAGSIDDFGVWNDHVHGWLDSAAQDLLVIRYEDFGQRSVTELQRVLKFAGLEPQQEAVRLAVENASFEKLRALEQEQSSDFHVLNESDKQIPFFRSGATGQWPDYFNKKQLNTFYEVHGSAMDRLGYRRDV